MSSKFSNLSLTIFNGKLGSADPLFNKTYDHWRQIWKDILVLDHPFFSDSFARQDYICSLHCDQNIVGLITASIFPEYQKSTFDHSYLAAFPIDTVMNEKGNDHRDIMSIEYLSVDPSWRKNNLGVSLGSVLLGLTMEIFKKSSAGCVLGTARTKLHVDEMCSHYGFKPHGKVHKYGLDCALIINNRSTVKTHSSPEVASLVNEIWVNHQDLRWSSVPKEERQHKPLDMNQPTFAA